MQSLHSAGVPEGGWKVQETLAAASVIPPPESRAITEIVLKVAQGCNIACDYCYMYTAADQSYRERPAFMSDSVVDTIATNMAMYGRAFSVGSYRLLFHGGEPLLRKPEFFDRSARVVKERLGDTPVSMGVQTNATRITREHLEVFAEHGITVGVSLDANNETGNGHRLFRDGSSSLGLARAGIERMLSDDRYRHLLTGALAVIDVHNNPLQIYNELKALGLRKLDFLFPLGNWQDRPPFREDNTPWNLTASVPTPYADWLITIFDQWVQDRLEAARNPNAPPVPEIRYFAAVMSGLVGHRYKQEVLGGIQDVGSLFVETDGSLHLVDALKTTAGGMTDLGVRIEGPGKRFNYLALAHARAVYKMRALGSLVLPSLCERCDIATVCGGGYYPTRYREQQSPVISLPSVYHPDLYKFITHVRTFMFKQPAAARRTG